MKRKTPKGFVILFTILIAAIIMVIGLGIYSIASRETVLSGTAREAQYAFYAADAGVECALYAQSLDNAGVSGTLIFDNPSGSPFDCGSSVRVSGNGTTITPYTFNIVVDPVRRTCAKVSVYDVAGLPSGPARRIVSQGYNICNLSDGTPLTSNPILVERDLDTLYSTGGGTVTTP